MFMSCIYYNKLSCKGNDIQTQKTKNRFTRARYVALNKAYLVVAVLFISMKAFELKALYGNVEELTRTRVLEIASIVYTLLSIL